MTHGRHSGYAHGCRCGECRAGEAAYQRERRKRQREAIGLATAGPGPAANPQGFVEAAVCDELADAAGSATRPGLAAVAVALARVLDNPKATSSKPAAAGALVNVLNVLHKGGAGGKRKLAAVREMTRGSDS